jgi:hypothetical protein
MTPVGRDLYPHLKERSRERTWLLFVFLAALTVTKKNKSANGLADGGDWFDKHAFTCFQLKDTGENPVEGNVQLKTSIL